MNEILNQKFGVEVEMYDITRAAKYQPLQSSNQRYTMRCWLLRLGFIGDEFATARRVFTNRLPGDTAWRYGRPPKAAVEAVA